MRKRENPTFGLSLMNSKRSRLGMGLNITSAPRVTCADSQPHWRLLLVRQMKTGRCSPTSNSDIEYAIEAMNFILEGQDMDESKGDPFTPD